MIITNKQNYKKIYKYINKYKKNYLIGLFYVFLTSIFGILIPWFLKFAIDSLKTSMDYKIIVKYVSIILLLATVKSIFQYLMRKTIITTSRVIEYNLRNDFFLHLENLPFTFFKANPAGDIMARGTNDLEAVRMLLGPGIMYSANTLFNILFSFVFMLSISPLLTVYTVAPLLLLSFLTSTIFKSLNRYFVDVQAQFGNLNSFAKEGLTGIRIIKSYIQEKAVSKDFKVECDKYVDKNIKLIKLLGIFMPCVGLFTGISIISILWFGGSLVIQNKLTIGDFAAFTGFLTMLTWPVLALGWVLSLVEKGKAAWGRINTVFSNPPEQSDNINTRTREIDKMEIKLNNLTYYYKDAKIPALKNISITIPSGKLTVLVGRTGSGKSTLLNLLSGFLDAEDNSIFIDGQDIKSFNLSQLRSNIAYVIQDDVIFSESIKNNLLIGADDSNISISELENATKLSHFYNEMTQLPMKIDSILGERGINLSGGQKQRLSIARALLSKSKMILMDDCFSSIDTQTENLILKDLVEEIKNKTTIISTHRLQIARFADTIILLDNGSILETGSHEFLISKKGFYYDLFTKQQLYLDLISNN